MVLRPHFDLLLFIYSGTRIKTRKRNIAAPLDPAAFADAVVQVYLDNAGDLVTIHVYNLAIRIAVCMRLDSVVLFGT